MNKQELIRALQREAESLESLKTNVGDWKAEGIHEAIGLAMQLDDQPAMAWQDEPTCEGWYWVRSTSTRMRACRIVMSMKQGWLCDGAGGMRPLNGRRVCPLPAPPPLPKQAAKGGDA